MLLFHHVAPTDFASSHLRRDNLVRLSCISLKSDAHNGVPPKQMHRRDTVEVFNEKYYYLLLITLILSEVVYSVQVDLVDGASTFVLTTPVSASTVTILTGLVEVEWKAPR